MKNLYYRIVLVVFLGLWMQVIEAIFILMGMGTETPHHSHGGSAG